MGQKPSQPAQHASNFNPSEWVPEAHPPTDPSLLQPPKMRTLRNRNTDQLIDKYEHSFLTSADYHSYLKCCQWRHNQTYIVRAYHLSTRNNSKYCTNTYQVEIYIEHPRNRLSDFSDIPYPDTLYCLKAMLMGYYKLYSNVGPFPVREEQVCIDERGQVRVWLNRDLSCNYPEEWEILPRVKAQEQEEEDMVGEIVSMVARNADRDLEPKPSFGEFYERAREGQWMGFEGVLGLIDEYAEMNGSKVPDYFVSVMEVYQNQDELYETERQAMLGEDGGSVRSNAGGLRERKVNLQDSQVQRITNRTPKSIKSASSYAKLDNKPNPGAFRLSGLSETNRGQIYRLSGLSVLQSGSKGGHKASAFNHDNNHHINTGTNNLSHKGSQFGVDSSVSQNSHQSQTRNQGARWGSFQPQQPYIPSSRGYGGAARRGFDEQGRVDSGGRVAREEPARGGYGLMGVLGGSHNRSISERPEEQNSSVDLTHMDQGRPSSHSHSSSLHRLNQPPRPSAPPLQPLVSRIPSSTDHLRTAQFLSPNSLSTSPYNSHNPSNTASQVQVISNGGAGTGFTIVYRPLKPVTNSHILAQPPRPPSKMQSIQADRMPLEGSAKTVYCTLDDEVELDAEIARDLLLYT